MTPIKKEFNDLMSRHSDKVPVILQFSKELQPLYKSKTKLLVDYHFTVSELMFFIRSKLRLHSSVGLHLFVDGKFLTGSETLYSAWDRQTYLLVRVMEESTFG